MLKLLALSLVLLAVSGTATNRANASARCTEIHKGVQFYKKTAWKYQDEFQTTHTRATKQPIQGCHYAHWVAKLWRKRAWKLRDRLHRLESANKDFTRASRVAHEIWPTVSTSRLWYRASVEGGHGEWYCNHQGSGACGWFQFMKGTYYGRADEAFSEARRRGFPIPPKYNDWHSMLGQVVTAAYMFSLGLECSGEGWAASC